MLLSIEQIEGLAAYKLIAGFDTGFFARGGEAIFFKKFWIFSDSRTDEFSYNNFSNSIFIGYRPV